MRKDHNKKNDKVLGSYRKVGTKFIPPMPQTFKLDQISWASQTMPELIWWDVLFDKASHRFAARVAEELAHYFKRRKDMPKHWWAFVSNYIDLSDGNAEELRAHLAEVNLLRAMTESLSDFIELYPDCPVSRILDRRPTGAIDIAYLSRFEGRLRELENKRSRNGVPV